MDAVYALIMCSIANTHGLSQVKCETPANLQTFASIDDCKKRRIELSQAKEPAVFAGPANSHFFYCAKSVWERAE